VAIGALGDIHGAFGAARAIVARHPEIPFWLCVGDLADAHGRYESLGARVYWIHGNNDNFDAIAAGELPQDLHHINNGTAVAIAGSNDPAYDDGGPAYDAQRAGVGRVSGPGALRVAGLGGTCAPTWYEARASDLPHPKKGSPRATELADKRRHFVREEVEACTGLGDIDVFMSHEAAKPFRPYPGGRGPDAGKAQINEILAAMRPRLHLFGHHHRFSDDMREGVRSVGLDLVTQSYLLVDPVSLDITLKTL
jgi:Calcineurin-like phosphoesterase superfamily domain